MEIKTKLNIDDDCYYLENNKIKKGIVKKIETTITGDWGKKIIYTYYSVSKDGCSQLLRESEVYKSVEELLKTLEEEIE